MGTHKLVSPISLERPKTNNFSLNLNVYRNTHYQTLNSMKKIYTAQMTSQVLALPILDRIELEYVLFPKTRRLCDVSNVCSVVDKFFCDVLVSLGKIEDDNYIYLPKVTYVMGEVDKDNPRVEITIKEI